MPGTTRHPAHHYRRRDRRRRPPRHGQDPMTLAPTGAGVEIVELLAEDEARELTEIIRRNIDDLRRTDEQVWRLLMVAYEREAWRALGYGSWREYATREYGLSQSYAYKLLDKARVIA